MLFMSLNLSQSATAVPTGTSGLVPRALASKSKSLSECHGRSDLFSMTSPERTLSRLNLSQSATAVPTVALFKFMGQDKKSKSLSECHGRSDNRWKTL